jgi:hypothetical protein
VKISQPDGIRWIPVDAVALPQEWDA